MSTPSEEEARAAAEAQYPALFTDAEELTYPRSALREFKRGAFAEGYLAALASRVSTSPADEVRAALAEVGLPESASLADLIRHHRGNAAASAAFEALAVPTPPSEDWEYATPLDSVDGEGNPYRLWVGVNSLTTKFPVYRKRKVEWEPVPATPVPPTEPAEGA